MDRRGGRVLAIFLGALALSAPAQVKPTDEDELEAAFEPDRPRPAADDAGPGRMDADVPAPRTAPRPVLSDEEKAESLFAEKLLRAATDAALAELSKEARALGPSAAEQVARRRALIAVDLRQKTAPVLARTWLLSCGAEKVDGCRTAALEAMAETPGPARAEAERVREADGCVRRAEGGGDAACLVQAVAVYRKGKDKLMLARATLAKGAPKTPAAWKAIGKLCAEPRCGPFRASALETLAKELLAAGDGAGAARAALEAVKLRQGALPASRRPYARTAALDEACAAYGSGPCRALEKQILGGYVFHDFSRKTVQGPGLPPEEAKKVTDHYQVSLEPCLQQYGEKSGSGRYRISWTLLNDGRVTNVNAVNVDPEGALMGCLKAQLARWRYPKYRGEWQHVEQEFRVSGTAR